VLGALVRRYGDFEACEDAVQEALIAAATQWPADGLPDNPAAWLITVASRRRIALWRSDTARRRREHAAALLEPEAAGSPAREPAGDDALILMLLCCHPALSVPSQVALTLRAVGGLTTGEIARGFLVPEATVGQRISRAKQKLRGARFELPGPAELPDRVVAVQRVLYLVFNEGYTASSGPELQRPDLTAEAIRLTRQLLAQLPENGETAGLLALMLLTEARRPARTAPDGALVPLAEQDRASWDGALIAEGTTLITKTLACAPVGPYQLQAAIAAVHDEAGRAEDTDWAQILTLYDHLAVLAPGPMVTLNRIVAVAMVHGPRAALGQLDAGLAAEPALSDHHRVPAVRAHLLELAGDGEAAREQYLRAARMTLSAPEQRYLETRARRASAHTAGAGG
jgi:RNA polymerase sigma factor (sigma-70 family)